MNWDYLRTDARPKALKHRGPPWAALPYSTFESTRIATQLSSAASRLRLALRRGKLCADNGNSRVLANNGACGRAFCVSGALDLGGDHRANPPRRAGRPGLWLDDARRRAVELHERDPHPDRRPRGPGPDREVPVSRRGAGRRAVAAVHDRIQPAGVDRATGCCARRSGSCRSSRWSSPSRTSSTISTGRRSAKCRRARGFRLEYTRRAVVLGARQLQLLPRADRDPDAGARPAPFPAAVSPPDRADHRPARWCRGSAISCISRALLPSRPRSHAAGIRRFRRVLYVGHLSPPPVRPRARGARHGGGQHGRRRARARRAAPHRRSECGRRTLHRHRREQPRPAGGRSGGVVERRRSPKTGRSAGPAGDRQDGAGAAGISRSRSRRCATHSAASSAGW